jgi:hypothetical protein
MGFCCALTVTVLHAGAQDEVSSKAGCACDRQQGWLVPTLKPWCNSYLSVAHSFQAHINTDAGTPGFPVLPLLLTACHHGRTLQQSRGCELTGQIRC